MFLERIVWIDQEWRRRQDAFWSRIEKSRFGPFIYIVISIVFVGLGLAACYFALEASSAGVVRGRGGTTYYSENPGWFSARVGWRFVLGALMTVIFGIVLWAQVMQLMGKRPKGSRKAPAKTRSNDDE